MGYRSCGTIWLPKETREKFKRYEFDFQKDLDQNWTKHEEYEDMWYFEDWKWYDYYAYVRAWNEFHSDMLNEDGLIDFIVIGEDNAIIVEPELQKLGYSISIDIF